MRTEYLYYLLMVAQTNSLNKASQRLGITHQTISTGITNLEDELDTVLLNRSTQGVSLTPAGEIMLKSAAKILQEVDCLKQSLTQMALTTPGMKKSGQLTILVSPLINSYLMPYCVSIFMSKYPSISLKIQEFESSEIIDQIIPTKGHLGLLTIKDSTITKNQPDTSLNFLPHCESRLHAVMSRSHPLAKHKSLSAKTIFKYPLVLYQSSGTPGALQKLLAQYGSFKIHLLTDSIQVYEQVILSGQAIGFLPKLGQRSASVGLDNIDIISIPIQKLSKHFICSITPQNLTPAKQELADLFIAEFKQFVSF